MNKFLQELKIIWQGVLLCLVIAVPSHLLGQMFPMFELTAQGLETGMKRLMVRR